MYASPHGAHEGNRTPDPRIKSPLLYRLSYMSVLPVFPGCQKYYGPHFVGGSGYWIRTNDYGDQNPMPYRLAKPPYDGGRLLLLTPPMSLYFWCNLPQPIITTATTVPGLSDRTLLHKPSVLHLVIDRMDALSIGEWSWIRTQHLSAVLTDVLPITLIHSYYPPRRAGLLNYPQHSADNTQLIKITKA